MGGKFQTSREIFKNPIWNDVIKFRLFFFIVGNAIFSEEGVRVGNITLQRGQFIRSYRNLAEDLQYLDNRSLKKYSISVIKKKVDQLVKENRLKIEDTELGTLFTVVNYSFYQGFDNYKNGTENGARTPREHPENNNKKDNKDKKEKRKTSCPKQVYDEESIPYKLAKYLYDCLKKNLPEQKEPNLQSWADEMRKVVELDEHDPKEVAEVIRWTQKHHFWWKNVMSPTKLRKQYVRLMAEIKSDLQKINKPKTDQQIREAKGDLLRKREIAFNQWIADGNNPDDFPHEEWEVKFNEV